MDINCNQELYTYRLTALLGDSVSDDIGSINCRGHSISHLPGVILDLTEFLVQHGRR